MNVFEMKTSELVAWYNEHSDKPVKKFSDRATAEARVQKLYDELNAPCIVDVEEDVQQLEADTRAKMSAAQRSTWADPEVRLARCTRNKVLVDGQEYNSVRAAFLEKGLPLGKHITFRGQLKKAKVIEEAFGYKWELV